MSVHTAEIIRYVVNGIVAAVIHYGVLTVNINFFELKSAGVANFIAAIFGVATSFLGNRYFVFKKTSKNIFRQAIEFCVMYSLIAALHGFFLWAWTDFNGFDYRAGFLLAVIIQFFLSYFVNRLWVFKK